MTEGKLADITVLDKNLPRTQPYDWIDEQGRVRVNVLYTIVGGRIVYQK